jgi:hypothetical protein
VKREGNVYAKDHHFQPYGLSTVRRPFQIVATRPLRKECHGCGQEAESGALFDVTIKVEGEHYDRHVVLCPRCLADYKLSVSQKESV